jgi:Protein of unknown function (DUF4239)
VLRGVVNDLPIAVLVVVVVGLTVGVVLLGVWLLRRYLPAVREGFDAEVSSQLLSVLASLFGLLLAFVIVIEYQNYGDAQSDVSHEADALAAIVRDSDAFAGPAPDQVRRAVEEYARAVVEDEWQRMRDGGDSALAWRELDGIFAVLQGIEPGSRGETAFYEDSVRQLNEALVARRDRLDATRGGLPGLIAALVLVGSFVILGYAMLVGSRKAWLHVISAGAIAILIAFSLVVLLDLSYPFSGDLAIEPDPFETGALREFFEPSG